MSRLRVLWGRLLDSLWFVPAVMVLGAVALAILMVELSAAVDPERLARWPRVFGAGADGSRSMLSGIASSMITVAGVTFSITMVAVTQASAQYTPRILRNFMRDRANQVVLGSFVGIFAYCIVVLRTIRGGEESAFVPSLAVLGAVLLAIAGIAVLIFFVHHIASTLDASEIISRVTEDTLAAIDRLFPEELGEEQDRAERAGPVETMSPGDWLPVRSSSTGYVQSTDIGGMVRVARRGRVVVRLDRAVGDFVAPGRTLAWIGNPPASPPEPEAPDLEADDLMRELARGYVVGSYRILDQDPEFGIRQLVDIALKALSPGINDTTTAVTCVDYLGAILQRLAGRRIDLVHLDDAGVPRVTAPAPTFQGLVSVACDEIRQNARDNVSVLARQLEMLRRVAGATTSSERRIELGKQITRVHEAATRSVPPGHDRERLDAAARAALDVAR